MTVRDVAQELGLTICCGEEGLNRQVTGAYAGDLLSDVIANSMAGNVWITMQVHVNIVAVAALKELSAIILVNGRRPSEDTLQRAHEEKVAILSAADQAFKVAGRLYAFGVGAPCSDG
jgi:predicted transcriptional regulator